MLLSTPTPHSRAVHSHSVSQYLIRQASLVHPFLDVKVELPPPADLRCNHVGNIIRPLICVCYHFDNKKLDTAVAVLVACGHGRSASTSGLSQ